MPHYPGHMDRPTAQSVLTNPNDLDLGMLEALQSSAPFGGASGNAKPVILGPGGTQMPVDRFGRAQGLDEGFNPHDLGGGLSDLVYYPGFDNYEVVAEPYRPADNPVTLMPWNQGEGSPSGQLPNTAAGWEAMIAAQKAGQDLSGLMYGPDDFGAPPPPPTLLGAEQTAHQYMMETQQPARPTDRWQMESTNAAQRLIDAMGGSASEAERYLSDLQVQGDDAGALRFAEMYAEESGVDLMDVTFDPSGPMYNDAGEMTPATSYGEMSPTDREQFQTWYNNPAVQEYYSDRTTFGEADPQIFKDFAAVQHFVSTLPSAVEVKEQAVKDVTQAEVDAYLKELDAMSDEDYNQIAENIGLSPMWYRGGDPGAADKKFLEEGNIRAHETGSFTEILDSVDSADKKFLEPGNIPAHETGTGLSVDNEAILAAIVEAKEDVAATGGDAAAPGAAPTGGDADEVYPDEEEKAAFVAQIEEVFAGLVTVPQHAAIQQRMAELGTTDLTQAIRNEFATITTPDYSANILQRYDEMGTALSDAAAERTRVLEETTTRAEGRIGEIKTGLKSELEEFETGRVEQQTIIEQGVIDRTTKMETDLVDRLDDIRIALGDQVTSEFEEVALLAGTLTSSQATSSRDAISRLTQIGNMAAAARLSAPAELSAEALTALSDLEFKVENEISQGLADSQAQIKMQKASALLQETMRRGEFETEKQRALVESVLGETLRGTVYEDRTEEMLAQALMQEDQYVRQFNEGVNQQLAGSQLQNLFGTQDYERQLDMMNLNRDWQTADTLQGRGWQTDDMTTARGWQEADYTKALADQRTDVLTERGWQEADVAAELERQQAAQPDPTKVLTKMRAEFPGVPDSLFAIAMHLKDMDWDPPMADAEIVGADWVQPQGWVGTIEPFGGANPGFMITEQIGPSAGEAYLRSLGEGVVLSVDELTGAEKRRSPQLSAEDYGSLQAMSDFARSLDSRADLLGQVEGMSVEELERFILGQGSGASTPWTPGQTSNPTGNTTAGAGTSTGSSNANSGDFLAGIPLTTSPQGFSALLAGLLSDLIYDR